MPQKNSFPNNSSSVQVINRAANILRVVRDAEGIKLSPLARQVKLPRSTVHRIVASLEEEGLLVTDQNGRICLGLELISLGSAVQIDARRSLRPLLEGLAQEVDETVDLSVQDKDHLVFLEQVGRPQRLQAVSGIGIRFPLHCTANGKALLARLTNEQICSLFPHELPVYTPHTIPSLNLLLQELELVRSSNLAYDREEHTLGICAVGAVIPFPFERSAAVSIPVPSVRFYGSEKRLGDALLRLVTHTRLIFHNTYSTSMPLS